MLMGPDGSLSFLEMNTRLQVEHGVTEEVTGVDLVAAQIRTAAGERLDAVLPAELSIHGHAIQARVYAEDTRNFFPSPGPLQVFRPPRAGNGIRIATGSADGPTVTPFSDPMLATVIATGAQRDGALHRLVAAFK